MRHGRLRLLGLLATVVLLAASCNWPLDRYGPERTSYNPTETAISPANVGQLSQQWTASLAGPGSDPAVADGHVFVTAARSTVPIGSPGSFLYSFDAAGSTNCSGSAPKTCTPQWSDPFASRTCFGSLVFSAGLSAPAVSNGEVWIGDSQEGPLCDTSGGSVNAYDENTGAAGITTEQGSSNGSPAVSGNTLYADWFSSLATTGGTETFAGLEAVNTATGASLFTDGFGGQLFGAPAVSNGILYGVSGDTLYAFDATGTTNCGPPPPPLPNPALGFSTFCSPLWSWSLSIAGVNISTNPVVANGYVYLGDSMGTLYALPAGGCGAAACSPAWTASTGGAIGESVAVTPTTVFAGSDNGSLSAFPAMGCGAATCQPLWTAQTGGAVKSSPSVGGSVVYVGSDDDNLYAFNASGCGAATCTPLFQTNVGAAVETSPAIANGQVFVADTAGTLHAYALPAASSS